MISVRPLSLKNNSSPLLLFAGEMLVALEKKLKMLAFGLVLLLPFVKGFFFDPTRCAWDTVGVVLPLKYGELLCVFVELPIAAGGVGGRPTIPSEEVWLLGLRNILDGMTKISHGHRPVLRDPRDPNPW